MKVFAIDPGNENSAYCVIDAQTLRPLEFSKVDNVALYGTIKDRIVSEDDVAVIEMVESFGMAVGKEVFETVFWIGRFFECFTRKLPQQTFRLYRKEEKLHICKSAKAKDTNIRQAMIDRFAQHDFKNGKGTIKDPDWFYGFSKDVWSAYAVAITFVEVYLKKSNLEG